ncbi:MAG: DUF3817 domain-containing protein [Verrucomicrobiota bacterium JB023]|nr:DUF3817 domain-containing protein [Verrucomicrobiota bacterium JB023]
MIKAINHLRLASFIEGLSWLALLGTMIYRAFTGHHDPVSWAGRIHGGLFCLFCLFLFLAVLETKWKAKFTTVIFLTSLVPFGFLFAEHLLRKEVAKKAGA